MRWRGRGGVVGVNPPSSKLLQWQIMTRVCPHWPLQRYLTMPTQRWTSGRTCKYHYRTSTMLRNQETCSLQQSQNPPVNKLNYQGQMTVLWASQLSKTPLRLARGLCLHWPKKSSYCRSTVLALIKTTVLSAFASPLHSLPLVQPVISWTRQQRDQV